MSLKHQNHRVAGGRGVQKAIFSAQFPVSRLYVHCNGSRSRIEGNMKFILSFIWDPLKKQGCVGLHCSAGASLANSNSTDDQRRSLR